MINIKDKIQCSGCNACGDSCPENAITFAVDGEGFWYPHVDTSLCVQCGSCEKVCPILNECGRKSTNYTEPKCYAAEHKSVEVLFASTSGGMFSALADVMYNDKGYVGGAVHNDDFSVSHFISNDRSDLKYLRRSKDLQSNAEGFYKKVKNLLEKGEKVLVCGLPCQIAGLVNFLGKEYENLITVDLICGGVNSPKAWRKYLDYIEEINASKIVWTENKSKEYGWRNLTQKFVFENGSEYFDTRKTSCFTNGYIGSHLYLRPSCYECRFRGFPRIADITIGDFWGIENFTGKYKSDMGTSVVMVNNEKGARYFAKASRRINCEEVSLDWVLPGNPSLTPHASKMPDRREEFFRDLDLMRFDEAVKKYQVEEQHKSSRFKSAVKFFLYIAKITRMNPRALCQTIKYSGIKNLKAGRGIICGTNCHFNVDKTASIEISGLVTYGRKGRFKRSKAESRLYLGKNAKLVFSGDFYIDAGNEIEVFDEAELIIHGCRLGYSDANTGLNIVCGQKIEIKSDVGIGKNVTIRDTNGETHFINTTGYRTSRPVEIGEKAWLCESCTVMPGVKVGTGAIVGACSMVTAPVPDHVIVSGNPASIVQENIMWKL